MAASRQRKISPPPAPAVLCTDIRLLNVDTYILDANGDPVPELFSEWFGRDKIVSFAARPEHGRLIEKTIRELADPPKAIRR